ncbi:MAG: hypothetical protein ACKO2G_10765 [Verrucomicrobiales bacterium]
MKTSHLFALLLCLSPMAALAQDEGGAPNNQSSESDNNRRFWQAELPGGAYVVALDRITSVGKHEYLVDGGFVVTEVTVDTVGTAIARFYYGEPYRPDVPSATGQTVNRRIQDTIDTVKERTGANQTDRLVVKNYPHSTHAHTIEFRLNNKENLEALFQSVNRSWMTGRGVRFTVKTE